MKRTCNFDGKPDCCLVLPLTADLPLNRAKVLVVVVGGFAEEVGLDIERASEVRDYESCTNVATHLVAIVVFAREEAQPFTDVMEPSRELRQ